MRFGTRIAAKIATMAMTIINSMRVNPLSRLRGLLSTDVPRPFHALLNRFALALVQYLFFSPIDRCVVAKSFPQEVEFFRPHPCVSKSQVSQTFQLGEVRNVA